MDVVGGKPSAAGWYGDPEHRFEQRFWDGQAWTSAVMEKGRTTVDPQFQSQQPAKDERVSAAADERVSAAAVAEDLKREPIGSAMRWAGPHAVYTSLRPDAASNEIAQRLAVIPVAVSFVSPEQIQGTIWVPSGSRTNVALAVLLLLICLIPGIIYLIVSSIPRTRPVGFTLALVPQGPGTLINPQPLWVASGPVGNVLRSLPQ